GVRGPGARLGDGARGVGDELTDRPEPFHLAADGRAQGGDHERNVGATGRAHNAHLSRGGGYEAPRAHGRAPRHRAAHAARWRLRLRFAPFTPLIALASALPAQARPSPAPTPTAPPAQAPAMLTGVVFDSLSMQPLAGASIVISGSTVTTTSDAQGRYAIR